MSERVKELSTSCGLPEFPGGRYRADGPHSGEEFREEQLVPALCNAAMYDRVTVVFDGVAGFGSSFLEEAFGGLVRKHGMDREFLSRRLSINADEEGLKDYVLKAKEYIDTALEAKEGRG